MFLQLIIPIGNFLNFIQELFKILLLFEIKKISYDLILGDFSLTVYMSLTFCERVAHEVVS